MVGHGFENLWKRKRSKDQGGGKKHGWEKGIRSLLLPGCGMRKK
jgi:hypothetical protein